MNIKLSLLAIFMSSAAALNAQSISGVVCDAKGERLVGASLWWEGTTVGITSNTEGEYSLHRVKDYDRLIASYVGFQNDTITVKSGVSKLDVTLKSGGVDLQSVEVHSTIGGNYISHEAIGKAEMISFAGLCKMACCNLAESFENSASVTVGYSDAISGARQIKMLGLAGTYTQMLDENRAIMRGLSAPYGLSYTPGMWLNSIQVSKGISSVTAGHEAVTGQINLEYRKPTDEERLFLNLFINNELRPEINISTAQPVTKDGKLSTVVMFHGSADTDIVEMDHNGDGFRDMPSSQLWALANRWSYIAESGAQLRWGFKVLQDSRLGGDTEYEESMRDDMYTNNIYGSYIRNRGANGYVKFGMPVGRAVYDSETRSELRSNVAMVVDLDHFNESAYFGLNDYYGNENSLVANAMYNHYFTASSSLIVGVSAQMQHITERLDNSTPWIVSSSGTLYDLSREENEVGAYAEYTYKYKDVLSLIVGARGDYNTYYDRWLSTPRGQVKWSITPTSTLRGSIGVGHRTSNVITDNIGMLATGRHIVFDDGDGEEFDRIESALTYGGSFTQQFKILKSGDATISLDYFRSEFDNQVVVDQEMDSENIHIYSTDAPSTTDTYQVDLTWKPSARFDIFATYRYTDSRMTLNRADGSTYEVERPLVSRYKTLLNVQYASHMRRWTFDVTAQLNGSSRLPVQDGDITNYEESPAYPMFFAQISRRLGSWEVYAGCENIANYRQENPILNSDTPYTSDFNSSVVWGPLAGRKFYLGARFNLY